MSDAVLCGDVGGTNVRFALVQRTTRGFVADAFGKFSNDDHASFDDALAAYFKTVDARPIQACFAVAGPVRDGQVSLTNRGWHLAETALAGRFGFESVRLINDFTAMARSIPEFPESAFVPVLPGAAIPGAPVLVAGPGTGLGVATLLRDDGGHRVLSGEGGHAAYAPRDALEFQLATVLLREHGYVSNELVCSGSGLSSVYSAFCEIYGRDREEMSPEDMRARADAGDEMFAKLIEVRAHCVMSAVGDLALANGTLGGVVLVGGVTERILDYLKTPSARARFVERGPMRDFLARCPVRLLTEPQAPLIGAAAYFEQERLNG